MPVVVLGAPFLARDWGVLRGVRTPQHTDAQPFGQVDRPSSAFPTSCERSSFFRHRAVAITDAWRRQRARYRLGKG
jgi:hypothetical protein